MDPSISIIIPARNDAQALRFTLDHLERLGGIETAEIIVAASGGIKATEDAVAGRARILWPGRSTRAALMNAGAAAAVGDIFFFLHADSFPPLDALTEIQRVLQDNAILGGAFEHRFAESGMESKVYQLDQPAALLSDAQLLRGSGHLRAGRDLSRNWRLSRRVHGRLRF